MGLHSYRHVDGLVQALRSGGAPEDGLSTLATSCEELTHWKRL